MGVHGQIHNATAMLHGGGSQTGVRGPKLVPKLFWGVSTDDVTAKCAILFSPSTAIVNKLAVRGVVSLYFHNIYLWNRVKLNVMTTIPSACQGGGVPAVKI